MTTVSPISAPLYGYGEVAPFDDLKELHEKGFDGYANKTEKRTDTEIIKWAKDTDKLATKSILSHLIELPLKIGSYFVSHSDFKHTAWDKAFSALEDIAGTFGDMFRNQIYAHTNSAGEYDDNLGAELRAGGLSSNAINHTLGGINNLVQTKGKFLTAALSIISPTLANDLEWAVVRAMDSCWWRSMSSSIAFGPGLERRLFNQLFGGLLGIKGDPAAEKITFGSVINKFKEHVRNANHWWEKYKHTPSENTEESVANRLSFYKNADKVVSSFIPVINWLNIAGDVLRPVLRRLNVEGLPRNVTRLLSGIDKPFFWVINFFRYYLPEKLTQNAEAKRHEITDIMDSPNLLLAGTIGEMVDFGTLLFEDSIKESSGMINHLIEITRRVSQSALDIYFSARRKQAARDLIVNKKSNNEEPS